MIVCLFFFLSSTRNGEIKLYITHVPIFTIEVTIIANGDIENGRRQSQLRQNFGPEVHGRSHLGFS